MRTTTIILTAAAGLLLLGGCASAPGVGGRDGADGADGPLRARAAQPGSQGLFGDRFEREIRPFEITAPDGTEYRHPFLGGFVVPRPQFHDIDDDGDPDLFVQERTDELMFFENTGTAEAPEFTWRTDKYQGLDVGEWTRFHDLDDDGDLDLLAERKFSYMKYWRNDGSPQEPRFVMAADTLLDADGEPIFSDRQNIPNLTDIDCDADPDLFLGRVDGTVQRWERVRIDEGGVPVFTMREERFENIEIVAAIATPGMQPRANSPGGRGGGSPPFGAWPRPTLHGANSMAFADVDGDGDQDFFWGDFFEAGLLWIENDGSCTNPNLRDAPVPVPAKDTILTSGYNATAIEDVNGDGRLDIVMGVLGGAYNPNTTAADNLHYYERGEDGIYEQVTTRFLDGFDSGSESIVAEGDLDGDGDLDLLVGNKLDPSVLTAGRIYHLENTGTPTRPAFAVRDTLNVGDLYHLAPELADIDGDGDLDLILGTWNDEVILFRNEGTPQEPDFRRASETPIVELTRGSHSVPEMVDLDGDGDLDLLVGESSGEINWYENVGSATDPRFELVTDALAGIDVGRRSVPRAVDLDGDGDFDLVLGREEGGALLLRNDGTPTEPDWVEAGELDASLPRLSAPVLVDLYGDGVLHIVSGGMSGGLTFFRNAGAGAPGG